MFFTIKIPCQLLFPFRYFHVFGFYLFNKNTIKKSVKPPLVQQSYFYSYNNFIHKFSTIYKVHGFVKVFCNRICYVNSHKEGIICVLNGPFYRLNTQVPWSWTFKLLLTQKYPLFKVLTSQKNYSFMSNITHRWTLNINLGSVVNYFF